ncbi:Serine carboxypeptidase-like 42 [Triticum urartu]|uniref:Carboxypeptidase n=1 Tax=Triticum urartu TaxID=4572 RepID=M7YUC6_TRIUA|nr:Serine carboxypeptidase-like 42 [Triticum urartu]
MAGSWRAAALAVAMVCWAASSCVLGFPEEDLVGRAGRSLFYYFAEAQDHAAGKPLTLWLNGGPGCSSVGGGAFTELGPFYPRGDVSNLLFVESPAGVGWSYSNTSSDYNTGDTRTANDMYKFLLGWYKKFPEYRSTSLFLSGESYAGHHIPQLTDVLLTHNEKSKGFKFNIKGVADCDFEDYTSGNPHNESKSCNDAIDEAIAMVGEYVDDYDVIRDVCYPSIVMQELRLRKYVTKISLGVDVCMSYEGNFYFNLPEVQHALHANRTHLPYSWSMCSDVLNFTGKDVYTNILPLLQRIVEQKIPVWVFSGDQDSVVPLLRTRTLVRELAHAMGLPVTVPYSSWFRKGQVGGWATEYGNMLTFATVRGASHMVPFSQPDRALGLFRSFVLGQRLPNTTHRPID